MNALVQAERAKLRAAYQDEFDDGARHGWSRGQLDPTERERGGYPLGFHAWTLERRNAWWAGASQGVEDRDRYDLDKGGE
jgi:hypothetical protein